MKTLVLNAGFEPMSVVSYRRAIVLVLAGRASVLAAYPGVRVRSAVRELDCPSVILLCRYVRPPHGRTAALSRRGVLRRDGHRCAYCGAAAGTVDHVLPRSRGGANSWENLVACCRACNNRKGDRTPEEIGWRLARAPRAPHAGRWWLRDLDAPAEQWRPFLDFRRVA